MWLLGFVILAILCAQALRLGERRAYQRGFRDGLRAAAQQVDAAERAAGVRRGWADFPRQPR